MVNQAMKMGYQYLAFTDHVETSRTTNGMDENDILNQMEEINYLNDSNNDFKIIKGLELEIDFEGNLPINDNILDEVDLVVASIHSDLRHDFFEMTDRMINAIENPYVNIISHPTGRRIQEQQEYELNLDLILETAHDTGTLMEINSQPNRLDLRDIYIKKATSIGCQLVVNSDAHHIHEMKNMQLGVATARRGWVRREDILNTMGLNDVLKALSKK
jgi:DNA polymerase (family 10)